MNVLKRTPNWIYVLLGERDQDEAFTTYDLVRVERETLKWKSLSDAVKCDSEYEEIEAPDEWFIWTDMWHRSYSYKLPKNIDEVVEQYLR